MTESTPSGGLREGTEATPARQVPTTFEVVRPATPVEIAALRERAADFAAQHGGGEELIADVALAVTEAVTNAVKHAYGPGEDGQVELAASAADGWLEFRVRDHGRGFGASKSSGLGLGLRIIATLCAELTIADGTDGTELRLRFPACAGFDGPSPKASP